MTRRLALVLLTALLLSCAVLAKKKTKQELSDLVLNAQTVYVVIHPDASEPITNPAENRTALQTVENALTRWGRFRLVMAPQTADLIIAIRKGHANGPAIANSPADDRPVILQPTDGNGPIGAEQRRPPGLSDPRLGPQDRGPQIRNEIGSSEDSFELYMGGIERPLDAPTVWRYMGKNALDMPSVAAVLQFQKAIDESEKQRKQKP